ncbi:MAG: putative zinc-binding protein [Anaerolineae bacterium]
MSEKHVVVVPCSGIGKTYGTVGREAAYELAEELRPGCAEVVALSLLVGDEQTRAQVQSAPAITIDGCKLACASKMVTESGGQVAYEANVLDTFRRHRHLKPKGIAELNEEGQELARQMALELAEAADKIVGEQEVKDA